MRILLSLGFAAAVWTAFGQGTFQALPGDPQNHTTTTYFGGTVGGTFQVTNHITVTDLGCFNYVFDSNPGAIQVGLWDSSGSLLASNTITPASTLVDYTRYESITPVFLDPGHTYHLGAYSTNETIYLNLALGGTTDPVTTAPQIALGNAARTEGWFASPAVWPSTPGAFYLGANFRFQDRVPEPASGLLLGLGGLFLLIRRKWGSSPK